LQCHFPTDDVFLYCGDICDQAAQLSEIVPKCGCFGAVKFLTYKHAAIPLILGGEKRNKKETPTPKQNGLLASTALPSAQMNNDFNVYCILITNQQIIGAAYVITLKQS